jgi:Family of unknown function (DUF6518)
MRREFSADGVAGPLTGGWQLTAVALALGAGLLLGVGSRLADSSPDAVAWFGNIGAPWLATAFAAGALAGSRIRGSLLGLVVPAAAVAGFYGLMRFAKGQANASYLADVSSIWAVVAAVGGPLFGYAGAAWRSRAPTLRTPAVALLAGAFAAEGAALLLLLEDEARVPATLAELGVAAAAPFVLLRTPHERGASYALMAVILVLGIFAFALLRLAVRSLGS